VKADALRQARQVVLAAKHETLNPFLGGSAPAVLVSDPLGKLADLA